MKTIAPKFLANPLHFLSLGFGSGLAPKAPGTFGTLAAVPVYWLFHDVGILLYLAIVALSLIAGIYICGYTAKALGVHDHPGIVWDEFVGYWITMIAVPPSLLSVVLGFVFFRLFDIAKPWPIRWIDRQVSGGLGIMLDDVLAAVFALCCVHLTLQFL